MNYAAVTTLTDTVVQQQSIVRFLKETVIIEYKLHSGLSQSSCYPSTFVLHIIILFFLPGTSVRVFSATTIIQTHIYLDI